MPESCRNIRLIVLNFFEQKRWQMLQIKSAVLIFSFRGKLRSDSNIIHHSMQGTFLLAICFVFNIVILLLYSSFYYIYIALFNIFIKSLNSFSGRLFNISLLSLSMFILLILFISMYFSIMLYIGSFLSICLFYFLA